MIQLSKHELKEGITDDMITKVVRKGLFSPCQLKEGEDPVGTLECSSGYWIRCDDGSFLKDERGNMIVESQRNVTVGRARYLLNHADKEHELEIQREVSKLIDQTILEAKSAIYDLKKIMVYAGQIDPDGFEAILYSIRKEREAGFVSQKELEAKRLCTPEAISTYNRLTDLLQKEDYDNLYMVLFQSGLPQVASFDMTKPREMSALIENFHASVLNDTLDSIKGHNHIYNVAKFNVSKK